MNTQDEALNLSHPRLLAIVYFTLLAIIATIGLDTLLYFLGIVRWMSVSQEIILAVVIAACFGALFGRRIVHCEKPYRNRAFLWGFLMVLAALPVYTFGFLYMIRETHAALIAHSSFSHLVHLYLFVLFYSFILVGVWLAIMAGVAAIYLRGHVVYFILQSQHQRRRRAPIDTSTKDSKNK